MDRISSTGTTTPENPSIQAYTHQTGSTLPFEQAIPMQFHMPFIANPFMSPFMPQHGTNAESAAASSAGANPPLPAFFFSPAQYQEMMQQYFAHMMSANHYGMNVAFPMPFTTAMARPSSQASQSDVCETVNGLHETRRSYTSSEREFSTLSTNCKSNLSSTGNFSLNKTEGGCSEQQYRSRCSPVESNLCETNGIESSFGKDSTKSDGEDVGEVTKKDLERKTSLPASDEKTTSLIRKQMSEIEKEVIRRSQNKNIKKVIFLYTQSD
ncbi:hypothetical protein DICVIV_05638 [Dictyocaulus viviparus]|uniref:Uncharacterized protein n=1 Tax=Dictyocaulus viviparus TaxID=29172 RepID=A0A0D8Y101_DICVI|nr:hypothetical protein DICVIV_05638 [Dictyocaulus viviparus]